MIKAPFDVWIEAVKDEAAKRSLDYAELASTYSFYAAWDEFDMTPEQALQEAIGWRD